MRSPGGNRTVAHPVLRQWQSCHIVKDTPWADGGIGLSFRIIRGFFGVQLGILRLIVWVIPKPNLLLFDRLLTDGREKWSPFNKYENTGTLSPNRVMWLSEAKFWLEGAKSSTISPRILKRNTPLASQRPAFGTRWVRRGIIYSKLDFHHPCTKSWHVTVKAVRRGIIYSKPAFFYGKAMPNLGMW